MGEVMKFIEKCIIVAGVVLCVLVGWLSVLTVELSNLKAEVDSVDFKVRCNNYDTSKNIEGLSRKVILLFATNNELQEALGKSGVIKCAEYLTLSGVAIKNRHLEFNERGNHTGVLLPEYQFIEARER